MVFNKPKETQFESKSWTVQAVLDNVIETWALSGITKNEVTIMGNVWLYLTESGTAKNKRRKSEIKKVGPLGKDFCTDDVERDISYII